MRSASLLWAAGQKHLQPPSAAPQCSCLRCCSPSRRRLDLPRAPVTHHRRLCRSRPSPSHCWNNRRIHMPPRSGGMSAGALRASELLSVRSWHLFLTSFASVDLSMRRACGLGSTSNPTHRGHAQHLLASLRQRHCPSIASSRISLLAPTIVGCAVRFQQSATSLDSLVLDLGCEQPLYLQRHTCCAVIGLIASLGSRERRRTALRQDYPEIHLT